jgi:protein SCO1/2
LNGHWTLAFVGYTFCPDICPMTMAMLSGSYAEMVKMLPPEQRLQLWFVSVDPKRDTVAQLGNYVGYFEQPAITGMTANHDQLFPFVRELGLMYAISTTTEEDYRVDHSASIVLINPKGQLVAMFKPEMTMEPNSVPVVTKAQLLRDFPAVLQAVEP